MNLDQLSHLRFINKIGTAVYEGWNVIVQFTNFSNEVLVLYTTKLGEENEQLTNRLPVLVDPSKLTQLTVAEGDDRGRLDRQYRRVMLIQCPALLWKYDADIRKDLKELVIE